MKNMFVLVLLVLAGVPLFGQIQDYRAYQKSIHAAELKLVRGQKQEALDKYQEVLISAKGNFVKDVYNALLLADELKETGCFFELLELLLPKNLSNDYLKSLKVFNKQNNDPRWQAFLAANKKAKVPERELRARLEGLARDDQYFRTKEGSYDVYGDTINHIDSINIAALLDLIANNRFPGEAKIGVQDIRGKQPMDIIFHHYCQSTSVKTQKRVVTPELISLVQAGKILPNKCGLWLEMQKGQFKTGVFTVLSFRINGKNSDWYVPILSNEDLMLVKQTREMLGMESLEEYYEKIRFGLSNPDVAYVFDVKKNIFEGDQELFQSVTKSMRKL
ncbi:hypothetical protein [Neolewinella persica]|uniref:hypothetical protein n=1 Tax=Neolewinella persica TaxID=70998 RepID=UPI000380BA8D|nr:hypothetical protein [Neolewinella persica]